MIVDMEIIHHQLQDVRRKVGTDTRAWAILVKVDILLNKYALKDYE